MLQLTWQIKINFEVFCEKEFPGKKYCSNKENRKTWLFVQAGNNFGDKIHYEYCKGYVALHIECDTAGKLQQYLHAEIKEPEYEWIAWGKPDYGCLLAIPVDNEPELFAAFQRIRDRIEPLIEIYVKDNLGEYSGNTGEREKRPVFLSDKNLRDVFKMNLVIPYYQRIYCWEEKNVYQLWRDIGELKEDKPYHLGAVILHCKGGEYHIVDGQQRLVTLTLILHLLELEAGETDSVECPLPLLEQKFESSDACDYIAYNKYLIKNYIAKYNRNKYCLKKNILEQLFFSVLVLSDESLDLAYTFFSNQNSKGIPLSDYNLLKAHHLRYVQTEEQAKHLAGKWDCLLLSENAEADLAQTLGMYLFRLRKWMRKTNWDEFTRFRVKNEFEAALIMTEIPPFGEKFEFYEKIQGGTHFFAYTEHFIYRYKMFTKTPHFRELEKGLNVESHWYYRDVIETLLFGYYLKFSEMYLTEALVCIERLISRHRYTSKRALLYKVLEYAGASEVVMMIDQATSPTFFLAEIVDILKRAELPDGLTPVQERYRDRMNQVYINLNAVGVYCQNEEIKSLLDDEDGK